MWSMPKTKPHSDTEMQRKGERGTILTQKQYDLIVGFHKNGTLPSQLELEEAEIGGSRQSTNNKTGRFKSWSRRMYLRLSDDSLIHKISGKKILPKEKFESVILTAHRGSQTQSSSSYSHHSTSATIKKLMKKYTIGKRSFGMSEETVRDLVMSCTTGSCAMKKKPQKKCSRKKMGKDTQLVSTKAKAKVQELQNSHPVVMPRAIVPKEDVATSRTATITRAVPLITVSGSSSKSSYPMVYTNNIFNQCRPLNTATGINPSTTAFLPHPIVPPNFIGVPQLLPGLGSKLFLVPHTPGTNIMSMLQATAPQTLQINPGSNLPGHVTTSTTQPFICVSSLSGPSSTSKSPGEEGYSFPDQAAVTESSKTSGKVLAKMPKTYDHGSKLLKSFADKSKKTLDALKITKTPELAKMLSLPTLVKSSARNNRTELRSGTVISNPPPLQGPLKMMKKVVENIESVVHDKTSLTLTQDTADKKTIICVLPFSTNSVPVDTGNHSSVSTEIPDNFPLSTSTDTSIACDGFRGQVSYSSLATVETTQSITAPLISLKTGRKADAVEMSPHKILSESSANTKKKLKAKLSSKKTAKGPMSPLRKDNLMLISSNTSKNGDASLLLQDPDTLKSIKLDRPKLLHMLKKEKSSKVRALLLRTLRRLKKSKVNPLRSCLNITNKEESMPEKKIDCLTETYSDENVSPHTSLHSDLDPDDECSKLAEWNRKCISVLGETISMYDPLLCSTFSELPDTCEEKEDCQEKLPFPDSGPLPHPHIWHHYEDVFSQRHCFKRLLPVFQDMKLDIKKSVMRDQSAIECLKKKIAYGESLINQFREYLHGNEN